MFQNIVRANPLRCSNCYYAPVKLGSYLAVLTLLSTLAFCPTSVSGQAGVDKYQNAMQKGVQAYREQHFEESEKYYQEALNNLGSLNAKERASDVYNNLSILHEAQGNKSKEKEVQNVLGNDAEFFQSIKSNAHPARSGSFSAQDATLLPGGKETSYSTQNNLVNAEKTGWSMETRYPQNAYEGTNSLNSYSNSRTRSAPEMMGTYPRMGKTGTYSTSPSPSRIMNSYQPTQSITQEMNSYPSLFHSSGIQSRSFSSSGGSMSGSSSSFSPGYSSPTPSASAVMHAETGMARSSWYHH